MIMAIDCYECKYRGTIPGDRHSKCQHPEVNKTGIDDCFMGGLAEAYLGKANPAKRALGIKGGGPTWPANFNPIFLTACLGFTAKKGI